MKERRRIFTSATPRCIELVRAEQQHERRPDFRLMSGAATQTITPGVPCFQYPDVRFIRTSSGTQFPALQLKDRLLAFGQEKPNGMPFKCVGFGSRPDIQTDPTRTSR